MASRWSQQIGLTRSLLIYYGMPWRTKHLLTFYRQFMQPGDLCFDIGSHVGNRLRLWLRLGAKVVGLEPQPHLMRVLQQLYGRSPHVTLLDQAVGAARGEATMYISERVPAVTTLSAEWIETVQQDESFAWVDWNGRLTVPVTTLDSLIAEYGLPAFCKIDVEGYELEVLQGVSQPLPALSFEYVAAAKPMGLACLERLEELGDYHFNWCVGESHRWETAVWLTAAEMKSQLAQIQDGSGDIYARLQGEDIDGSTTTRAN